MRKLILILLLATLALSACSSEPEIESTKDYYEMVSANIIYGEETLLWASNTNSRTLGDEIDRENEYEEFLELKKTDEGRIIHSFKGHENNEDKRWMIFSESCGEDQRCTDNVDEIILDEEREFIIIYDEPEAE